jgi:hypothetical protein
MIRKSRQIVIAVLAAASTPVLAQTNPLPIIAARLPQQAAQSRTLTLPANTELVVRLNNELSTKQNKEGDAFVLSVAQDVMKDGYIVIPRGSKAVGEVTWMTGKGAFGKSGKMDIEVRYAEVSGQRIPLVGKFRQEGEGNTVATVGALAVVWVAAPFITGRTGRIPAGRELTVFTRDDLVVALPDAPPTPVIAASSPATAEPTVAAGEKRP